MITFFKHILQIDFGFKGSNRTLKWPTEDARVKDAQVLSIFHEVKNNANSN